MTPPSALIDPLRDERWARLVARAPDATIFHHPMWLSLLRRQYRYPMAAAVALDGDGEAVAGLPVASVSSRLTGRRLVALPFSDACPPLVAPGAGDGALGAVAGLLEAERRRRGVPLEVRADVPALGASAPLYLQHLIDLTGEPAEIEGRYASRVRRNVRKAERSGVTVARRTDREALDTFYALHLTTRRRQGVPTQPKAFIRAFEGLFAAGLGFVGLAEHEGAPVAAAVFLRTGRSLLYKYGASDPDALAVRPNNKLFADVIRWAGTDGLEVLDLGRTDAGQDGLIDFKRSWGAEERALAYTYAGRKPPEGDGTGAERRLGEVIQRSHPLVGRLAGELLYRHVG